MNGLEWLQRFAAAATRLNMHFDIGSPEMERMLDIQQAEAAVFIGIDGYTVILRSGPTASAVLEEFAHCLQARRVRFSSGPSDEVHVQREIEAKECLVANASKFALPQEEQDTTLDLLKRDRATLERIRRSR